MKKRIISAIAVVLCLALMMVACGDKKAKKASTDETTVAEGDVAVVEGGDEADAKTEESKVEEKTEDKKDDEKVEEQKEDKKEDEKVEEQKEDKKEDEKKEDEKKEEPEEEKEPLPPAPFFKDVYADMFEIGVCLNNMTAGSMYRDDVVNNFTSVTCENEMKPDSLLDQSKSRAGVADDPAFVACNFSNCNNIVKYCETNGLKMRLHTLAWHSQTPSWFFYEDYNTAKPLVSKDIMIKRLENYITQVIEYFDKEHPGLIYAIDVVNEAFNGDGKYATTNKNNKWYDVMEYDYVYYAFLYAREAIDKSKNMKDCILVYNDYNMIYKTSIVPNGLNSIFEEHGKDPHDYIDALGMQSHLDTNTSMQNFVFTAKSFLLAGYGLQITELDIGIPNKKRGAEVTDKEWQKQGQKFRYLMDALVDFKNQGYDISSVTVWGINDANSWRANDNGMDAHALLWLKGNVEKPAARGFARCDDIVSYYTYGINF